MLLPPPLLLLLLLTLTAQDHPMLQQELDRAGKGDEMAAMDTARYSMPPPAGGERAAASAWASAVENGQSQLEHQQLRLENLELLQKYGSSSWRTYNGYLESIEKRMQGRLYEYKTEVAEINRARKLDQTAAAPEMHALNTEYFQRVAKLRDVEWASEDLRRQIKRLKPDTE